MKKLTAIILIAGVPLILYRAAGGLGAVTSLSDYQPWGLVKALNIFTGAAFAAGSFVVAAAVHVFGLKRLKPVVRPALMMGFVGHGFVLIALLYDVGRPLDVWRILTNPQPNSALLWTAVCEVVYTTVMAVELFGGNALAKLKGPLAILAASIAIVYQATLGTLLLAPSNRISSLWYSPALPLNFLLTAMLAGIGAVMAGTYLSDRAGRRVYYIEYTRGVGWTMFVLIVLSLALRLGDLFMGGALVCNSGACTSGMMRWYAAELGIGLVLPAALLLSPDVRRRRRGLMGAALLVMAGVVMNRLGVTIVGWVNPPGASYFPSGLEILASIYFVLSAASVYWLLDGGMRDDKAAPAVD